MSPEVERSFDNTYSVPRGQTFDVPFQNPENLTGRRDVYEQSGASVNSLRSDKPCAPLNNISLPLRFSADSSKVTSPGCPLSPESILKPSAPLPALYKREVLLPKQADKRSKWRGLRAIDFEKPSGRALLLEAIYALTSVLEKTENSPISRHILQGWRMARGAFGRGLGKLKVPDTDVRADGALV